MPKAGAAGHPMDHPAAHPAGEAAGRPRPKQGDKCQRKRDVKTGTLLPQEQDLHALLRLWLRKVDAGRPLRFATFREAWQELHFSLIYEGCHDRADFTAYMQSLLAVACDHLLWPLPPVQPDQADPSASGHKEAEQSPGANAGAQRGRSGRPARRSGLLPSLARGRGRGRSGGQQPVGATATGSSQQPEAGCEQGFPPSQQPAQGPCSSGQAGQPQARAAAQPAGAAAQYRMMDRAALMALLLEDDEGAHAPLPPPDAPSVAAPEGAPDNSAAHLHRLVSQLPDLDVSGLPARWAGSSGEPPLHSPRAPIGNEAASEPAAPFELQVGALYALYTLHETQPGTGGRVRPYVSLTTLRALGGLIRRAREAGLPDVPAVARRLVDARALVVGAMCRPPASTQLPPVAPPRHAQADVRQRHAMHPVALAHLRATQADLRELRHLQLLANSYGNAQRRLFAAAGPADLPPSIADLKMGDRLHRVAEQMRTDIVDILGGLPPPKGRKRDRQVDRSEGKLDGRKKKIRKRSLSNRQHAKTFADIMGDAVAPIGADSSDHDDDGGGGADLSGLPPGARTVFARKAAERAAMRRAERQWAAAGVAALAAAGSMPGDEDEKEGAGDDGAVRDDDEGIPPEAFSPLAAAGSMPGDEDKEGEGDDDDAVGDAGEGLPPKALPLPAAAGAAVGLPEGKSLNLAARVRVSGGVPEQGQEDGGGEVAWDGEEEGANGSEAAADGADVRGSIRSGRGAAAANGHSKARAGRGATAGGKGGGAAPTGAGGAGKGRKRAGEPAAAAQEAAAQGRTRGAAGGPGSAAAALRAAPDRRQAKRAKHAAAAEHWEESPLRDAHAAAGTPSDDDEHAEVAVEQRQRECWLRPAAAAPSPVSRKGRAAAGAGSRPDAQGAAAGKGDMRRAPPGARGGAGRAKRRKPYQAAGEDLEYDILGLPVVPDLSGRGAHEGNALEQMLQEGPSASATRGVADLVSGSSQELSDLSQEDATAPDDGHAAAAARSAHEEAEVTIAPQQEGRSGAGAAAERAPQMSAVRLGLLARAQPAASRRMGPEAASAGGRPPSKVLPPVSAGAAAASGVAAGGLPAGDQRKALDWEQFERDMLRLGEQADALLAEGDF